MNCQQTLDKNIPYIQTTIQETMKNWREHAFGFSNSEQTPIYLGDCDEVVKPSMLRQIGTFHTHTIENSRPSPDDFDSFLGSSDTLMCYARPLDDFWNVRCYNREKAVCAEQELRME